VIKVETPRGVYEGSYQIGPAATGFVALLKAVRLVGAEGRVTPLPVATELRGRWSGQTEADAVEGLVRQFETWARAQP
jgi:hypothetical protein